MGEEGGLIAVEIEIYIATGIDVRGAAVITDLAFICNTRPLSRPPSSPRRVNHPTSHGDACAFYDDAQSSPFCSCRHRSRCLIRSRRCFITRSTVAVFPADLTRTASAFGPIYKGYWKMESDLRV